MNWWKVETSGDVSVQGMRSHTSTLVGNKIFVFGGKNNNGSYNQLYIFDLETMTWRLSRTSGDMPSGRAAGSATFVPAKPAGAAGGLTGPIQGKIYFYGGGDDQMPAYDELHILDIVTLEWTKVSDMKGELPGKRRAHTCDLIGGKYLYMFGGGDGTVIRNDVHILDTESLVWTKMKPSGALQPGARGYHSSCVLEAQKSILIFGGSDGKVLYNDLFLLNTTTSVWTKIAIENPTPRLCHSTVLIGQWIFLFGGHNSKQYDNDIWALNLGDLEKIVSQTSNLSDQNTGDSSKKGGSRWLSLSKYVTGLLPEPRGYHTMTLYENRIVLIGGYDGRQTLNDVHFLDLGSLAHFNIKVTNPLDLLAGKSLSATTSTGQIPTRSVGGSVSPTPTRAVVSQDIVNAKAPPVGSPPKSGGLSLSVAPAKTNILTSTSSSISSAGGLRGPRISVSSNPKGQITAKRN